MSDKRFLLYLDPDRQRGKPVLWPVYVAKVLYPVFEKKALNVFEEAVLRLARAGCVDDADAAGLLCLDKNLILHIRSQLRGKRLVDRAGAPTRTGLNVLAGSEDDLGELKVGYAFQDAIGGEWIPRFEEDLQEIEANGWEHGSPYFELSRETADRYRPKMISHKMAPSMDPAALHRACASYMIDHFHARQRDDWDSIPARLDVRDLSFLEDTTQAMWILTWIHRGKSGEQPWLVSDPFRVHAAAAWLRKPLELHLKVDEELARFVANLSGMQQSVSITAAEYLANLEIDADLALMSNYNFTYKVPRIQERLAAVLRKKILVVSLYQPQQEDLRSLLNESQNLAETALQWILETYPMEARLPKDGEVAWKQSSEDILNNLQISCLDSNTARRLSRQQLRDIRYALEKGTSSLKALLTAALLATANHLEHHPLLKLSEKEAGLGKLLDLADTRNRKGAHAGHQEVSKDEALEHTETALAWVRAFKDWY